MTIAFLKNLGVDEIIIQALSKSYGENLDGLQVEKDDADLKLSVKDARNSGQAPEVMTIHRFFEKKAACQVAETPAEYATDRYNCRDTIVFLPNDNSGKGNVEINGHKIRMGDSSIQLLKYLAQELKKETGGWVFVQDLVEATIIPSDGYQPFSRLRNAIAGYLLNKNPMDFIEANGKKQYRISTDPGNVSIPKEVRK